MNLVLQALSKTKLGPVMDLIKTVKTASDPNAALAMAAKNNPLVKQAMDIVAQNGGNMEAAFKNTAQQYGASPDEIMNMLK